MPLFTVNLCVKDWPCLVVGAGAIALPKARRLIEAGARVTIVAPQAKGPIEGADWLRREVQESDLDGKRLAILGTDDRDLNRRYYELAIRRGLLAAAVDDLEAADFFMPALLRRGELEIAVSTSGRCPPYSVWVRDRLAEIVDDAWGRALGWFADFREANLRAMPMPQRTRAFRELLARPFLERFRGGQEAQWEEEARALIEAQRARASSDP